MCNSCKSRMESMETTEVCKSNSVEETENFKAKNAEPRRSDEKDFQVAQERVQNEDRDNDKTSSTLPEGERALNVETPTTSLDTDSENASSSPELAHLRAPPQHCVSGFFRIHTANHVVFDDAEARQTIVEFFYDDHRDVRHVIRARGVRVTRSDLDGDYCVLDCVTHDAKLGPALDAVRREWSSLWNEVKDKLYGSDVSMVVSHPHGCSKQFSVGRCLSREWGQAAGGQGWYRYTYDVPTCPGSSGAPVWVPGRDGLLSGYAPHSGSFNADVARSAVWFFWNMPQSK
ncbi:hypothetical protein EGW08_018721 [Elysia chlorotica]|uniref:Uncharacterized protein n=1 Tax=Elysia chlorotica TaxID=188477 RepID=A0A3S1AVQ1_ELYCH|nr:hypothetical protein EGW08_018721 [Elysia chlorotica]